MPVMILKVLKQEPVPVYGIGENVRDWLFVEDHVRALCRVLANGSVGETYNIGGPNEKQNRNVVHAICDILDAVQLASDLFSCRDLITFMVNRIGHDHRYATMPQRLTRPGLDARRRIRNWSPEDRTVVSVERRLVRDGDGGYVRYDLERPGICEPVRIEANFSFPPFLVQNLTFHG